MGSQASIDIKFSKSYEPRKVVFELLRAGWSIDFDGEVSFLVPSDIDSYNWQTKNISDFDFDRFLSSHPLLGRVGLVMVFDKEFGGEFLIYPDWTSLSLSVNRVCLFGGIPDFSRYINALSSVISCFQVFDIKCECIV